MEKLLRLLSQLHDDIDYTKEEHLLSGHLFDSFDLVTLVVSIRQEFGVRIPVSAITPDHFDRAESIYALIQSLT